MDETLCYETHSESFPYLKHTFSYFNTSYVILRDVCLPIQPHITCLKLRVEFRATLTSGVCVKCYGVNLIVTCSLVRQSERQLETQNRSHFLEAKSIYLFCLPCQYLSLYSVEYWVEKMNNKLERM